MIQVFCNTLNEHSCLRFSTRVIHRVTTRTHDCKKSYQMYPGYPKNCVIPTESFGPRKWVFASSSMCEFSNFRLEIQMQWAEKSKFSLAAGWKVKFFACGMLKTQNFRLRQAETSKFSPAACWNVKIFACDTLKRQNFRLRCAETSKFSPAARLSL